MNLRPAVYFIVAAVIIVALGYFYGKSFYLKSDKMVKPVTSIIENRESAPPRFVGGNTCAECHKEEYDLWLGSHHDLAMQKADDKTVVGDFNDKKFDYYGQESRFYKRDGKFMVRTDGPDGKPHEYEAKYTFGVYPLQQYLIEFPGGRLQALGIAWDSRPEGEGGQKWFHLYPDQQIKYNDELHWTGINQNWNYMCADCHSTDLKKNYDPETNSFSTSWSEINVSCEACHGPGSRHVEWARKSDGGRMYNDENDGLIVHFEKYDESVWSKDPETGNPVRIKPLSGHGEIETCARCHSRRGVIWDESLTGGQFMDTYLPVLLNENLYYPDGQIKEEVYEYGSFLQSRMYHEGVRCTDCHNAHSLKLRAEGNALCAGCHQAEKYDAPSHHHHAAGTEGAECVGCHMPETTYMVIDRRRDHSIRIPRPDLTVELGTPNACNKCHADKGAEWASGKINEWYGPGRRDYHDYGGTLNAGRTGSPQAENMLSGLAENMSAPGIARATAFYELRRYVSPQSIKIIERGLKDPDPMVRAASVDALEGLAPAERKHYLFPLLSDPVRAVRIKAARLLAAPLGNGLTAEEREIMDKGISEYVESQLVNAERPESHLNLGILYNDLGEADKAESEYRRAIEIEPSFAEAYVNLADLYRIKGNDEEGERLLQTAITVDPQNAGAYHALGLLMARRKNMPRALESLEKAATIDPDDPRYSYVYAIALNSVGSREEAIEVLDGAYKNHPYDREILYALATINRDAGNLEEARIYSRKLIELDPANPDFRSLFDSLSEH